VGGIDRVASVGTAAAGLAQINAISNLAGFGTTYVMGFIKEATGKFTLALVPLVALAAAAALAILWIGRVETRIELAGGNQATVGP
jgi:ACS family tartrate transporter-like MFS transporter